VVASDGDEAFRVMTTTPIEQLLGSEGLRSLGALMVIDRDERLRAVGHARAGPRALAAATPGRVASGSPERARRCRGRRAASTSERKCASGQADASS